MAIIEGFRVQNFRALRNVSLGRLSGGKMADSLTPLTVVIGKNGAGKSTLFDALGFVADCLAFDLETACNIKQRGGFDGIRSQGASGPIQIELCYREEPDACPITWKIQIDQDKHGRPFVQSEVLLQQRRGQSRGRPYPFLRLENGQGTVWAGEVAIDGVKEQGSASCPVELTDPRQLGISVLGTLKEHPRICRFRDFIKGWYFSDFSPDATHNLPRAGPQRHLNVHGDNMANVVQFMEHEHKARFGSLLASMASKIPGLVRVDTRVTDDGRVLLRFHDSAFDDPFCARQISDGNLRLFFLLLLIESPEPPSLIFIENPENGLYHKLLETLVREFHAKATGKKHAPHIFVTTHQPYFVDALSPEEVWILERGPDGFSTVTRASDLELVKNMVSEGLPLGGLWYRDYLEVRQECTDR